MSDETMESRLLKEGLISMSAAAKLLPLRRGKCQASSTAWRYCVHGVIVGAGRVHLEAVRLPAGWATTAGAVARFLAALTDAATAELRVRVRVPRFPRARGA